MTLGDFAANSEWGGGGGLCCFLLRFFSFFGVYVDVFF